MCSFMLNHNNHCRGAGHSDILILICFHKKLKFAFALTTSLNFWDACHQGLNRLPRATFCCLLPYAVYLQRIEIRAQKVQRREGYSQSWTLSNKPQSVFPFALMPESCWPARWSDKTDTCFSRCEGLNSPVGRFSSLWVIVELFQVLAARRALGRARWLRGSSATSLESRCNRERTETAATGPLETSAMT